MISVPRDTGFVPLPDESLYVGGLFPGQGERALAAGQPRPGDRGAPTWPTTRRPAASAPSSARSSLYLGIEIHHYALVDMAGFAELIDALGGAAALPAGRAARSRVRRQPRATSRRTSALVLPAGCHQYDGLDALAYARSRKGWIEMPDGRGRRRTTSSATSGSSSCSSPCATSWPRRTCSSSSRPCCERSAASVSTDVPRDQAGDLASLLPLITGPDIERVVLGYPEFVDPPLQPEVNYVLTPRRDAIREEMARIFGADALSGWYLGTTAAGPNAAVAP